MAAPVGPRQGDHVFNDIETAILRPFEAISAMPWSFGGGRQFLARYLLHTYEMARDLAGRAVHRNARTLSAPANAGADAVRELGRLVRQYPELRNLSAGVLLGIHTRNSTAFGDASRRFEWVVLKEIQEAIEKALDPQYQSPSRVQTPGLALQAMLNAAYDPAAALVVLTGSMSRETSHLQGALIPLILEVFQTLEQPGSWREPFRKFHQGRPNPTATGRIAGAIWDGLLGLDSLKMPGTLFSKSIRDEIAAGPQVLAQQTTAQYGEMLHLLHQYLQRIAA
jgi:hypothetical protein